MDQLQPFRHGKNCPQRCKGSRSPPLEGLTKQRSLESITFVITETVASFVPNRSDRARANAVLARTVRLIQLTSLYIGVDYGRHVRQDRRLHFEP
jgi:hypothetical protein